MLLALFSSRVRVCLLTLFLLNPDARWHANALTKTVRAQYSAVWKELVNLETAGLLLGEPSGKIKTYRLNPQCPILPELRTIILKTVGVGDVIRQALADWGAVDAAFIYGSFAASDMNQRSDIDLMIIGRVSLTRLAPTIARLEKELGRAINYVSYTPDEWREKVRSGEPFTANVLAGPKIMLIGVEDAIRGTPPPGTHQALQGKARRDSKTVKNRGARPRRRGTQSG